MELHVLRLAAARSTIHVWTVRSPYALQKHSSNCYGRAMPPVPHNVYSARMHHLSGGAVEPSANVPF
jgi:hypothetical protein